MNIFQKLGLITNDEAPEVKTETTSEVKDVEVKKTSLFADSPPMMNIPGQVIGEVNDKVYAALSEAIERNNLPGNDFLEFMMALQNLAGMAVDEKSKFVMVFATLNTTSDKMSKEKLLSSIDHYLTVIEKEKEIFTGEMLRATGDMVTSKENRVLDINKAIQSKIDLINKTQSEIAELTTTAQTLSKEAEENKYKVSKKEADFGVTSAKVVNQIMGYKTKIEQFIS